MQRPQDSFEFQQNLFFRVLLFSFKGRRTERGEALFKET